MIHQILQTLVIGLDCTPDPIQTVPPDLEVEHHNPQFQIARGVICLMRLHLAQSVSNHVTHLHKNIPQT